MNDEMTLSIRNNYDLLAEEYARKLFEELQHKPLDRELLSRFASRIPENGLICDMGCGPGHVTKYLHNAGASVFGLDLSPRMVQVAKELNPDISFQIGNMMAIDIPDGLLAGISAFYAIVNLPEDSLPVVFREMKRVLQPGGVILLAFHIGNHTVHLDELWGRHISLDFHFLQPSAVRGHLEVAGFEVEEIIEREPYAPDVEHQSRRAYIFARKRTS